VSDENNCTTTMSFEIEVLPDTEAPMALAQNITVSLDLNGTASVTPAMLDDGSTDNCSIASQTLDISSFGCNNIGENTVSLTVTDGAGNISSAMATVTVVDEVPPVIVCPQDIFIQGGSCTPTVTYPAPTATDNCGTSTLSVIAGPESGANFPINTMTIVTWAADDSNGNTATCSFTVMVISDFAVNTSFTEPSCHGGSDGSATAITIGGTPPFTYAWSDPANQQTQTAMGLMAGSYSVSVTDATGCLAVQTVQVTTPSAVTIVVDEVQDAIGGPNGFIQLTANGGAGNYTYEWSLNGSFFSNEADIEGLWDGEYQLVVTDENGCSQTLMVQVDFLNAIEEKALEQRITLSPNPSSGRVFVNIDLGRELPISLQVLDLSGRMVLPAQLERISSSTIELDLRDTAPGVYLLRIIVNESVVVKRLVVGR